MRNRNKIIVALDGLSEKEALRMARILKGYAWGFKVNDLLFENGGIIHKLKKFGNVFADAKLHDIPNTVANSVKRLSSLGADLITVHAEGGVEMMKAAKKNAGRSKILAVTVLTSDAPNIKKVTRLALNAMRAKVDGIVCSGQDLAVSRNISGWESLLKVVPGIRPIWYKKKDDQKQTIIPQKALELGAHYLVIGRPITGAKNPVKVLRGMQKI